MKLTLTILFALIVGAAMGQSKNKITIINTHVFVGSFIDTSWHNIDTLYRTSNDDKKCFKVITSKYLTTDKKQYQLIATYEIDKNGLWQFYSAEIKPYIPVKYPNWTSYPIRVN